jgi:TonB-linked SusC/RagA family outer membrane protein
MEKQHKKFFWQGNHQIGFLSYAKCVCCFLLVFAGAMQTISAAPAGAQSTQQTKKKVVGNVKDENGEALIGVTIAIKGQSAGTVTDINGNFSLEVSQPSVLVVSYIGYTRQFIDYTGQQTLAIKMLSDAEKLNEVVVVGYGTQKMKNVTGSMASVDMQKLESLPTANLIDALAGQIPGMSVTTSSGRPGSNDGKIQVRQVFDFNGGTNLNPIIVIDDVIQLDPGTGLPSMDRFNRMDPSEIEQMTVLRDASAAIYGSRASQGAIVIKTKRGKEGAIKISYSGKFEWNDAVSHEKVTNAYETGLITNSYLRMSSSTADKMYSASELEAMKSLNYNWLDKAWTGAGAMQHSVNVTGGNGKANYFAGGSFFTQGANLGVNDYKRYNFRAGSDINLTKNLKISATLSATNSYQAKSYNKVASVSDGSYGSAGAAGNANADYMLLLHMPQSTPWSTNIGGTDYWVSPALGPNAVTSSLSNVNIIGTWNYFALMNNGSKAINDNFDYTANFAMQYDVPFVKGLSLKGTYSLSRTSNNAEQVSLPFQLALAGNTNAADNHLYGANTTWTTPIVTKGQVLYDKTTGKSQQMNFYVNYDRKFGQHTISAMGSVERIEGYNEASRVAYDNPALGIYNGSSATAGTLSTNTYLYKTEHGHMSYLGRASYDYAGKYLAQLILRSDASTNFAPEHYWGFFPSLSLGWVLSEENWFKDGLKWVDFLKLRGSIGKTGRDNIKAFNWMQMYQYYPDKGLGFGSNGGLVVGGVTPNKVPNRDATWDSSVKYNVGMDLNILNNRLSTNVDGYFDRNTNILTAMSSAVGIPISVGGNFAELNYSAVDAWGVDIGINWKDKIGEVKYSIGVNTSLSWNKLKKYPTSGVSVPSANAKQVGQSLITPQWGYKTWKGNEYGDGLLRTDADIDAYWNYLTEKATAAGTTPSYFNLANKTDIKKGMLAYQDLGGILNPDGTVSGPDGQIKTDGTDKTKLVNRNTNYGFSTNLGLSWKSFSWSAQLSTSWGTYTSIDYVGQSTGSNRMFWSRESFWSDMYDPIANPNGKWANIYYSTQNNQTSDYWQVSSFRCYVRSMNFAYALPNRLVKKAGIESAKLSISGNNLWDLFNPYPDHYRNMYDSSTSGYPTLRTWALGVNLTF